MSIIFFSLNLHIFSLVPFVKSPGINFLSHNFSIEIFISWRNTLVNPSFPRSVYIYVTTAAAVAHKRIQIPLLCVECQNRYIHTTFWVKGRVRLPGKVKSSNWRFGEYNWLKSRLCSGSIDSEQPVIFIWSMISWYYFFRALRHGQNSQKVFWYLLICIQSFENMKIK